LRPPLASERSRPVTPPRSSLTSGGVGCGSCPLLLLHSDKAEAAPSSLCARYCACSIDAGGRAASSSSTQWRRSSGTSPRISPASAHGIQSCRRRRRHLGRLQHLSLLQHLSARRNLPSALPVQGAWTPMARGAAPAIRRAVPAEQVMPPRWGRAKLPWRSSKVHTQVSSGVRGLGARIQRSSGRRCSNTPDSSTLWGEDVSCVATRMRSSASTPPRPTKLQR
jgi:hypothetical protein